eukprot:TRINITY_DN6801_c0_g1_i1.p1 TRINITY_DN6801_c0_g1~~TRINITY_DN6801_c0_g1_i1.p1  ORF type:complete len:1065 (-),score=247.94 TRINITY_DN6801_c0_g1_i1:57-3251(-)
MRWKATILIIFMLHAISNSDDHFSEIKAGLIDFYNAFNGDYWYWNSPINPVSKKYKWDFDDDNPCDWDGVVCEGINNILEVAQLDLINMNVSGNINSFNWTKLPYLNGLLLSANNIYGNIPDSLKNNSRLKILFLEKTDPKFKRINGTIDDVEWDSLKLINIAGNDIEGNFPDLSNSTALETIFIARNRFTGTIPDMFDKLTSLKQMSMESNRFEGTIPESLYNCYRLELLIMGNNTLSGSISPNIGNLGLLKHLDIQGNLLSGSIPEEMYKINDLERIYLQNNAAIKGKRRIGGISGTLSHRIGNLDKLKYFHISNNKLEGNIPGEIYELTKLIELFIGENKFEGVLCDNINDMTKLEKLNIGGNLFTGTLPRNIWKMKNLQYLDCAQSKFVGTIPSDIYSPKLQTIILSGQPTKKKIPKIYGTIPPELFKYTNVSEIFMSNLELSGTIPEEIGLRPLLRVFDVGFNNLEGTIPESIFRNWKNAKEMRVLILKDNKFEGSISPFINNFDFGRYNKIREWEESGALDLSNNNFQGIIPRYFLSYNFDPHLGTFKQALRRNIFTKVPGDGYSTLDYENFAKLWKGQAYPVTIKSLDHHSSFALNTKGSSFKIIGDNIPQLPYAMKCCIDEICSNVTSVSKDGINLICDPIPIKDATGLKNITLLLAVVDEVFDTVNYLDLAEDFSKLTATYYKLPKINKLTPAYGPESGNTEVKIYLNSVIIDEMYEYSMCRFGTEVFPPSKKSKNGKVITCVSPSLKGGGISKVAFSMDGVWYTNPKNYKYYYDCGEIGCGYGSCINDTLPTWCDCTTVGFLNGSNCWDCKNNFWGAECGYKCEIDCKYGGICDDGLNGTGACLCKFPRYGEDCSRNIIYPILLLGGGLLLASVIFFPYFGRLAYRKWQEFKEEDDDFTAIINSSSDDVVVNEEPIVFVSSQEELIGDNVVIQDADSNVSLEDEYIGEKVIEDLIIFDHTPNDNEPINQQDNDLVVDIEETGHTYLEEPDLLHIPEPQNIVEPDDANLRDPDIVQIYTEPNNFVDPNLSQELTEESLLDNKTTIVIDEPQNVVE